MDTWNHPGHRHVGAALAMVVLVTWPATAAAELRGAPAVPTEAGCDLAVELHGPIARVTETHRVAAGGPTPAVAVYDAPLAAGAVVDGFAVTVGGRDQAALVVPRESLDNHTPDALGLRPDPGVLRVRTDGDRPVVEAALYPVGPGGVTAFTLRWSVPLAYADGRLRLTLPPRGAGLNLGRCQVHVAAVPATGIRAWSEVRGGGVWLGAGRRVRGTVLGAAPDQPFAIESRPVWSGTAPVLAAAHAAAGSSLASAIAIYVPDQAPAPRVAPARLLFVIDTSISVGADGRRAAATLVETLGRAAPAGTTVEAVLFARQARRALGAWVASDRGGLARIVEAMRSAPAAGGSDLAGALGAARAAIGDDPARIVIITDGVLPTDQTGDRLLGAFPVAADQVVIDAIVPLVPGAAAPERGGLEPLTAVYGGRVLPVPTDRLPPAAALTARLATGQPLDELEVLADGVPLVAPALPDHLDAGAGVFATTRELSQRPRRLELRARRGGHALTVRALALPPGAERFAVAAAALDDPARELALARRHRLIGGSTAAVVIDRAAPGGAPRHDVARRTGALTLTPPPADLVVADAAAVPADAPSPRVRHRGELPRHSVDLALRHQLLPRLRLCYRDQLRGRPAFGGELLLELEIARGEVMAVNLSGDHFPESLVGCVADAAFALTTPTYELGDQPDTIFVVRKPVTLRPPEGDGDEPTVDLDDVLHPATTPGAAATVEVDPATPL